MKGIISVCVQEDSVWIKAMSFSSAVRTPSVSTWISIFWLISAVRVADCQAVELQTSSPAAASCGEEVTLTCDANSSQALDIKVFNWVGKNGSLCENETKRFECKHTSEDAAHHRLTLTISNLMPIDAGRYICKFHANLGVKSDSTTITVKECRGNSSQFVNESHAVCSFQGVFPGGVVHWFQGAANLTGYFHTEQKVDQHGLYTILSTIQKQEGNLSQPYNCSLWTPSLTRYHSGMLLEVGSSGSGVRLQWICVVMGVIMVKIMTI